jgi:hypothetical protein
MDSNFSSIELLGDVVSPDNCDALQEWLEWAALQIAEKRAAILRYALTLEPDIDLKASPK